MLSLTSTQPGSHASPRLAATFVALAFSAVATAAGAQSGQLSGKEVVAASCAKCHASGANGSPKIGDRKAWASRSSQGLSSLTEHALKGIREMPAHGGNLTLSDFEIKRAVTYMVNRSGGKWQEPIDKTAKPAQRSGAEIVKAQCSKCHQQGKDGAPKIGDRDAWISHLKDGLDNAVRSAINGHGGMPARGGMPNLTDAELKSAVVYMFRGPQPVAKK
jgi:cytochrome c5